MYILWDLRFISAISETECCTGLSVMSLRLNVVQIYQSVTLYVEQVRLGGGSSSSKACSSLSTVMLLSRSTSWERYSLCPHASSPASTRDCGATWMATTTMTSLLTARPTASRHPRSIRSTCGLTPVSWVITLCSYCWVAEYFYERLMFRWTGLWACTANVNTCYM